MFFTAYEAALLAPVRKSRSESAAKLKNFSLFPVGVLAARLRSSATPLKRCPNIVRNTVRPPRERYLNAKILLI